MKSQTQGSSKGSKGEPQVVRQIRPTLLAQGVKKAVGSPVWMYLLAVDEKGNLFYREVRIA